MTHAGPSPRRRIVPIACISLAVSLISPLDGALRTGATAAAAPTSITAAAAPTSITAATAPTSITAAATATAAAELTAASPPDAAHPFSDPIWSPLRTPARVSCVRTNCPNNYHGYWAIDFLDTDHSTFDPLYAAGAGIFHIGARMNKSKDICAPGGVGGSDTWVWIDHGGGRSTRYQHLEAVLPKEGQLVTPNTQIGTMGHNGFGPCNFNYLHMEYRVGWVSGPRVPPRVMLTCTSNGRVSMPTSLGYAAWDLVPTNTKYPRTKPDIYTPTATNACLATSRGAATANRPVVTGARGPGSATVSWGVVPVGVNHTLVTIEQWHPSLNKYGNPVYREIAGRASTTKFGGLLNGRPYRFRVTEHNGAGYSAWSTYINVTPTMVPSAPSAPRTLSTTRDSIRYGWWVPANNGRAITRFLVARRCVVGGSWTRWGYTSVAAHPKGRSTWNRNYNWTRMPPGRTCQVTVRALNSAGYGPWSVRSKATTRR